MAVLGPYQGALGDLMTMVEPALELAAQDIEMSDFLPGYRIRVHLVDSKCTKPDATTAVYAAFSSGLPAGSCVRTSKPFTVCMSDTRSPKITQESP